MSKPIIETLEIQISVPDPGYDLHIESMISQWGLVPYPELSVILVYLRYLAAVHQVHHWTSKGDTFYGDHLLFERLYNETQTEIDSIAEKSIGLGSQDNVNLRLQFLQLADLTDRYGTSSTIPLESDFSKRSYGAEVGFLRCVDSCVQSMKEKGTLSRGLDNLLAGMQDLHESHVYLLKQRSETEL